MCSRTSGAPAQGLRERAQRDRAPYDLWRDRGLLTATPGASVDHEYVAEGLATLAARCDLRVVRFDRWRINDLERALERIGAKRCGSSRWDKGTRT